MHIHWTELCLAHRKRDRQKLHVHVLENNGFAVQPDHVETLFQQIMPKKNHNLKPSPNESMRSSMQESGVQLLLS